MITKKKTNLKIKTLLAQLSYKRGGGDSWLNPKKVHQIFQPIKGLLNENVYFCVVFPSGVCC